jgi:hypothetical protein
MCSSWRMDLKFRPGLNFNEMDLIEQKAVQIFFRTYQVQFSIHYRRQGGGQGIWGNSDDPYAACRTISTVQRIILI